jgi:hypothetical protein
VQLGELLILAHIPKQIPLLQTVVVDTRHRRRWRTHLRHGCLPATLRLREVHFTPQ